MSRVLTTAVATAALLVGLNACTVPRDTYTASADACPDIEVVFARGTGEAPGLGHIGGPFVDSLRKKVDGRSVGAYAVSYPASGDFAKAADGANDASRHVQHMVATCPNTKIVLGGFSQGAAVIDLIAAAQPMYGFTAPMPPEVADHVAAVAVFGNPSRTYLGKPLTELSPLYGPKTIDVCIPYDPICSGGTGLILVHGMYLQLGLVEGAVDFVAARL